MPGVADVTLTSHVPLGGSATTWSISLDPEERLSISSPGAQRDAVLPGYFEALGIPLLEGRSLRHTDSGEAGEVVVNETMARRFWPGESALGKRFRTPAGVATVVGVSGDVRHQGLERPSDATFYLSLMNQPASRFAILVRTRGDARAMAAPIRTVLRELDSGLAIIDIQTMEGLVSRSLVEERYRTLLVGMFGVLATLLAAVGAAGVAARAIAQRLREYCIHMAVGAAPRDSLWHVMHRGLTPVAAGVVIGALGALASAGVLRAWLFEVRSSDPVALVSSMVVLLVVVALALVAQARRVLRPDLAAILRTD